MMVFHVINSNTGNQEIHLMDDQDYKKAKKRVHAKKEFYQHLGSYIVFSFFFFLINAVTNFGNWWFYWPMLGWGIGIFFHYIDAFGVPGIGNINEDWEAREIQREMKRLRGREDRYESSGASGEEELELPKLRKEKKKKWDESDLV